MRLSGHMVLISGGSSGIGQALAEAFLAAGNEVVITGRNPAALARCKARAPALETAICDIQDPAQIAALAASYGGRVSVLINAAGVTERLSFTAAPDLPRALAEIDINLGGMLRMIDAFLPHLRARPEAALVNVSSALAFIADASHPVYSATKAAQHSLTQSLRHELRGGTVKVFELIPPLTDTPMAADVTNIPKMAPAAVAAALLAGMARDRYEIAPGLSRLTRAFARIAPAFAFAKLNP